MIRKVKIENYKSVQELELELGRVNVFIGENGCGKTSILEAIAIGSAASDDRLDDEFLSSRGVRISDAELIKSAFHKSRRNDLIRLDFEIDNRAALDFEIDYRKNIVNEWIIISSSGNNKVHSLESDISDIKENFFALLNDLDEKKSNTSIFLESHLDELFAEATKRLANVDTNIQLLKGSIIKFAPFLIFAPENFFLRRFEEEGQIRPLGIRGEGLFRHLTELSKENAEIIAAISQQLNLIDWFEKIEIPNDLQFSERRINITDRFIKDTIAHFDQRSANEGFLYLLFYFTLFLSKYTPHFFAIDNIDNALNPKLCAKLTTVLAKLSAENDKQVILTTHNPAILDGLDLTDDEQRLFVIYRNIDGETTARRVPPPKPVEGVEPVRLSEAFIRGYLGGLPKNF